MDDVTKAEAKLAKAKRYKEASDFWDRAIVAGQQTEAGKAIIQREQLEATEKTGRTLKP